MEYKVYILHSSKLQKYYVGHTVELERRLAEHNTGKGNFTSKGIPWELIRQIDCASRAEAMLLEQRIKKRGIKRYLQDQIL